MLLSLCQLGWGQLHPPPKSSTDPEPEEQPLAPEASGAALRMLSKLWLCP